MFPPRCFNGMEIGEWTIFWKALSGGLNAHVGDGHIETEQFDLQLPDSCRFLLFLTSLLCSRLIVKPIFKKSHPLTDLFFCPHCEEISTFY